MSMTKEEAEMVVRYVRNLGIKLISGERDTFAVLRDALTGLPDELFTREAVLSILSTVISVRGELVMSVTESLERHCAELESRFAEQVH